MAITKGQKRLIVFLCIALGYAGYDLISNSEQYQNLFGFLFSKKKSAKSANEPTAKLKNTNTEKDTVKNIAMGWGRDPFFCEEMRPPPKKKIIRRKPEVKLNLNAITFSGENSIVIINNQILKEGQHIEGYLVEKIYLDKVRLSRPGKTIMLETE